MKQAQILSIYIVTFGFVLILFYIYSQDMPPVPPLADLPPVPTAAAPPPPPPTPSAPTPPVPAVATTPTTPPVPTPAATPTVTPPVPGSPGETPPPTSAPMPEQKAEQIGWPHSVELKEEGQDISGSSNPKILNSFNEFKKVASQVRASVKEIEKIQGEQEKKINECSSSVDQAYQTISFDKGKVDELLNPKEKNETKK